MKRIRSTALLLSAMLVFAGSAARADQTDPGLANLFDIDISNQLSAGTAHMAGKRYEEALSAFDAVIDARPDIAEGWNKRATLNFIMGRYAESTADIAETLKREPVLRRLYGCWSAGRLRLSCRKV